MSDVFPPFSAIFSCAEKAQRGPRVCTLDRAKQGRKTREPQASAEAEMSCLGISWTRSGGMF